VISSVWMLVNWLEKECLNLITDINHKIGQRYMLFREILKKNFSKVGLSGFFAFLSKGLTEIPYFHEFRT